MKNELQLNTPKLEVVKKNGKIFLIVLFCLVSISTFGQPTYAENDDLSAKTVQSMRNSYLPIINSHQIWIGLSPGITGPEESFRYSYSEDSMKLGANYYYQRVQSINEDGSDPFIFGAYRESDGKIFQFDESSSDGVLILDMQLNLDDTITIGSQNLQTTLRVIHADSVQYSDNVWRKRLTLNCLVDPVLYETTTWIEGIGEVDSYSPHCALDNFAGVILCVRNEIGELIYNTVAENDCWTTVSTSEIDVQEYKLYPNPATDELFIEGFGHEIEFSIYSLSGQMIMNSKTELNRISLEHLHKGMYLLKLRSAKKIKCIRFVKL